MSSKDVFLVQSNRRNTLILYGATHLLGCLLFWFTEDKLQASGGHKAVYFLGIFLALVGAYGIILSENIRIIFDGRVKKIFCQSQSLFFGKTQTIDFDHVARVRVLRIGKDGSLFKVYHLSLALKSGEAIATGRWARHEKDLRELAERIVKATGCETSTSWH
jgi:hypothetical protein